MDLEIFIEGFWFSGIATSAQLQVEDQKKKKVANAVKVTSEVKV